MPKSLSATMKAQREQIEREFILKGVESGLTVKEMARQFNCKPKRIREILRREEITLPSQLANAWNLARRENLLRMQKKSAEVAAMNVPPRAAEPPAPKPRPCGMCKQRSLDLKKVSNVLAQQDESLLCPSCYGVFGLDELPSPQASAIESKSPKPAPKSSFPLSDLPLSEDEREANRLRYELFLAEANENFAREQQEIAHRTAAEVRRNSSPVPFGIYHSSR